MRRKTTRLAIVAALTAAGCASGGGEAPPATGPDQPAASEPGAPALPAAPWSAAPIDAAQVPRVYSTAWSEAENRETCDLLAPVSVEEAATARRAAFGGGWAVAYDMPELRSAFGVAGTGASADGDTYDDWPYRLEWVDGSVAGYGPEGGTGPNYLAYLTIPGQSCLYNVWSRFGPEHLEELLGRLRFVR